MAKMGLFFDHDCNQQEELRLAVFRLLSQRQLSMTLEMNQKYNTMRVE
jgi:hypothetical protein